MKKIFFILVSFTSFLSLAYAAAPTIECGDLPGCGGGSVSGRNAPITFIGNLIAEVIKYVAVIAVIALMIAGIRYLLSAGDEEKTNKAKTTIIWALVWVLLSISSWYIINLINNLYIF